MLPAAASLKRQGANKGATTAFLISTPESGVDSIAITYALLDPIMTVIRPIAAFVTALAAGSLENFLHWQVPQRVAPVVIGSVEQGGDGRKHPEETRRHVHSVGKKIIAGLHYGLIEVWGDIVLWFFVGLLAAALITVFVPETLMTQILGGGLHSMLIMLLVGVPLYICASASTPVAAALIVKGVSPGAALVFLLVGPATNITSLSVLVNLLGKRSTLRYLLVLSACAVLFGTGVDALYQVLNISPQAIIGEAREIVPPPIKLAGTIVLLICSIHPLYVALRNILAPSKQQTQFFSGFPEIPGEIGPQPPCKPLPRTKEGDQKEQGSC